MQKVTVNHTEGIGDYRLGRQDQGQRNVVPVVRQ